MVMLTSDTPVTTVEQLLALPEDGLRHELLRGEHVVTPSAVRFHQRVSAELVRLIGNFTVSYPGLATYHAPSDLRVTAETLVQPDVFVMREDCPNTAAGREIEMPELVIEILSPGTAGRDRGVKREIYQKAGVAEYWIVDIDSRLIERWRPWDERPEILRQSIEWRPDEDGEVLTIDLAVIVGENIKG
jgi:Uma2 family endonuclease